MSGPIKAMEVAPEAERTQKRHLLILFDLDTGSCHVAQVAKNLVIFLPQPPKCCA